ncbi:hypothetical protein KKC22_13105 [Myxococcota bacterium]|nr:hypothetical protein [Myxococcota bacterium]
MRQLGLILFCLAFAGCDSAVQPTKDAGPDVPDHVDVPDVVDVDVVDVTDTVDATGFPEGFPAASCEEDPTQTLVASGDMLQTAAYYPHMFLSQYNWTTRSTTVHSLHVETMELRELFTIEPEFITKMVFRPEDNSLWISGIEPWNYQDPTDRDPPRIFRWDLATETLEDLTPQLPNLRSPACETNLANLTLQMIDLERNRLLLHCDFALDGKVRGELYFYDLTTSEKVFLGRHTERYYHSGLMTFEANSTNYFQVPCKEWSDVRLKTCFWRIDGPSPNLVYQSWDGIHPASAVVVASAEDLVYQSWLENDQIVQFAYNLQSGERDYLPEFPVFPQGLTSAGKLFPRLLTWVEGYDPSTSGYWIQASQLGHLFLTDRDTMVHRQVTCLDGFGRYGLVFFFPGNPTGRWAIISSSSGSTLLISLKDLHAAGIMSEDGHLLPPPEK